MGFSFTGTEELCWGFKIFFNLPTSVHKEGNIWTVKTIRVKNSANFFIPIFKTLYNKKVLREGIYLNRKFRKFLEFFPDLNQYLY